MLAAKQAATAARQHWGIENNLHRVLDVVFAEDASRVRKDRGPENTALLRRIALTILKQVGGKESIRGKRLIAGWNNQFLEQLLREFLGI